MSWTVEFARIERQREALVAELAQVDEVQLSRQLDEGRWSAKQVIEHLILAECGSLDYLSYKLSQGEQPPPPGLRATLRSLLLNFLLWQPIKKIRAPELVSQPRNDRSTQEVLADWAEQRQQLKAFLSAAPDPWHRALSYKHPLMGRLTLVAMLTFFGAHVGRHTRQIRRTIRAVSS
jgi:hypothetical protein